MLVVNLRSIKISIGLKTNLFLLNLIQMRFNRSKSGKKLLAVGKILLHFTLVFYLKNDLNLSMENVHEGPCTNSYPMS